MSTPLYGATVTTDYWRKPIPTNKFDWSAVTNDYEPGHPVGYGSTEREALGDLVEQLQESYEEGAHR